MSIEIKVPVLPESVADATIATWHKKVGDSVRRDENLVDIETDKVVLEVVAPSDGVIEAIVQAEGAIVTAEQVIGQLTAGAVAAPEVAASEVAATVSNASNPELSPAVRRLVAENDVDTNNISGTGKKGRIIPEDIIHGSSTTSDNIAVASGARTEKRVPMSRLRAMIAKRLVDAQHTAAILTTFNEVNMQPIMDLRSKYKDKFEKTHGTRLGFMSFFVMAVVEALKRFPAVNASIDGKDMVYHNFFDIGIAVSSPRGLVVPIIRDAENLSAAAIEKIIRAYGQKAKDGKLSIDEMTGGTFTISNGGVFGSLLSTPILNPPQSAILGMHKIEQRPIVEDGAIVIRPMMYLALSYDHRIIDGSESVKFLVTIKDMLEDPARLLLEI